VIITHEGLLGLILPLLKGWGIAVDEVPRAGCSQVRSKPEMVGEPWPTSTGSFGV
jgi:hypothetical protein